jgi:26S proteasome regulatory subunit N13
LNFILCTQLTVLRLWLFFNRKSHNDFSSKQKRKEDKKTRRHNLNISAKNSITMYSDLFDALGGNPNASSASNTRNSNNDEDEVKPLVSFKAGKMELALQENGKFLATPDTRRCQVNLKYNDDSCLVWEWYDRREKKVIDTIRITDPVALERVDVPKSQDADCNDRVYFWKLDSEWRMIWLQDKEEDPELIDKVNKVLKETTKPSEAADSAGVSAPSPSSVSTTTGQVDALSNILENLGMPQGADQNGGAASAAASAAAATNGGGTKKLTLADLQSAMGGVSNLQENPPGLHEVVSPSAISGLLENEEVRNRLLQELPEEQRSAEFLESCLRSPQVQQVRLLTTCCL